MTFIEQFLHAKHCFKGFHCNNSFSPDNNPLYTLQMKRPGHRLRTLLEVMQLLGAGTRNYPRICVLFFCLSFIGLEAPWEKDLCRSCSPL